MPLRLSRALLGALAWVVAASAITTPAFAEDQATIVTIEPQDKPRFRFGVGLDVDVFSATRGEVGLGGGMFLRFGAQFNRWFGIYYQPHAVVGGWFSGDADGAHAALLNSLMFELTLPFFHIAFGPSLDAVALTGCGGGVQNLACLTDHEVAFGLANRMAFVLGSSGPGPNGGFSVNLLSHYTFLGSEGAISIGVGLGGDLY